MDEKCIQTHCDHQILSLPVLASRLGASNTSQSHQHQNGATWRYPLLGPGFNSLSPNQPSYLNLPITPVAPLEDHTTSLHPLTTVVCHSIPLSLKRYSPFEMLIKKMSQHHRLSGVTTVMS